jgi:thymidylate synthase
MSLYEALLGKGTRNEGQRGKTIELLSTSLRITRPRTRISRSESRGRPFSALGELLWYLSGSDSLESIEPYIPRYKGEAEGGVLLGAYGPRLFRFRNEIDQVRNVLDLLSRRSGSRRAVIQLFDAHDLTKDFKEIPCTTTLQFHLRDGLLHMTASMRSNDAYWGLPHDVFCFTMLQEMFARKLGVEMGEYYHHAGSMHVYEEMQSGLHDYLEEGHHRAVEMPPMPAGDPFKEVPKLLKAEAAMRRGERFSASDVFADPYWADITRLIEVFWARKDFERLSELKAEFAHDAFGTYLDELRERIRQNATVRPEDSAKDQSK